MANIVFIATSLDGYIADSKGSIDWLSSVPNPNHLDLGFGALMDSVDAIIMGRNTLEVVVGFDGEWPYPKPVFVLSDSMKTLPAGYEDKVELVNGSLPEMMHKLNSRGLHHFYIDGGKTIQSFLAQDLIDQLVITQFPLLLGGGAPLFAKLNAPLSLQLVASEVLLGQLVQSTYQRHRQA